jgi:hypothetical protein
MSEFLSQSDLSPEERFLWDCARSWRDPVAPPNACELDWARALEVGRSNRMQALLHRVLSATGLLGALPPDICASLREDVTRLTETAGMMADALRHYLRLAETRGLDTVVLKGLSVSVNIYGDPAVRPGGDIDLLVRRDQVQGSLEILEEMGLGRWWPHLLDDVYYDRHHLHQQRCTEDLELWFEVHWAFDHPYTLLTIDYEALMDRATRGELLGEPVQDLAIPDFLLSLVVHLVKHAVYLPCAINRRDLCRIILADGMLLYFLDVAELIKLHAAEIDWAFTVDLARQSGAVAIFGSVLQVCREYLSAPVPEWVLDALAIEAPGGLIQGAMNRMADYEVVTYLGRQPSRLWDFMLMTNGAFILRPIRMLDTATYFHPNADYLQRRYGSSSWKTAARHLLRAAAQYARLAIDTVYYTWDRYRRLKSLDQRASLFTRLDADT